MIKTIVLSMCLAASSLSLNARAQDERAYTEGPVTEVDYIGVEYGHFEEYIDWLNSTWKPTMEAMCIRRWRIIGQYMRIPNPNRNC
jgi:hypothetical protein